MAKAAFNMCKDLNCFSVHIGGGEPFLKVKNLLEVLEIAQDIHVSIDYIETNSSWYREHGAAVAILEQIRAYGVDTLLISASPFHLEFIPFKKVLGVVNACREAGVNPLIWTDDFFHIFKQLDPEKTYSINELEKVIGRKALHGMIASYWIHPGGRALETFFGTGMSCQEILVEFSGGCKELLDTSHFHIDLYGNYIPGLCSGLAIRLEDLGRPIDPKRYPLISILYEEGICGLYRYASEKGFSADKEQYGSKCSLCFKMRKFLLEKGEHLLELAPSPHYKY